MQTNWTIIKNFATTRGVSIQWIDLGTSYFLKAFDGPFELEYTLFKDSGSDQTDFETNFKSAGNLVLDPRYTGSFILPISITPSLFTSGSTFWTMRNNTSGKKMYIMKIVLTVSYGGVLNSVNPSSLSFCRFSGATPSGGSALTAVKADTSSVSSNLLDARQGNGGLTMTGTTVETAFIPMNIVSQVATSTTFNFLYPLDHEYTLFCLNTGEGICLQAANTLLSGVSITGFIQWVER